MERSTTAFRKLLAKGELIVAPGAHDALTGRLVEQTGFPAVYMGGNATGSQLGVSEPLTTLTETVDNALRVMRGIEIPLIADANAGFGDPVHTYRTVREFERAGVAAIHIEDQPFPKRAHYHKGAGRVTPLNEVVDKLKAALDARRDPDFVIIGRTDVLRVEKSLEATLERCHAFKEVGCDMVMVTGPTPEHGRAIRAGIPDVPLVWLSGYGEPELSTQEIAAMGYQLVIYPSITIVVAFEAMKQVLTHLREDGNLGVDDDRILELRRQVMDTIGLPKYWEIEANTTERTS